MVFKQLGLAEQFSIDTIENILGTAFLQAVNALDPDYEVEFYEDAGSTGAHVNFKCADRTIIVTIIDVNIPVIQVDFAFTDSYEADKAGLTDNNIYTEDRQGNNKAFYEAAFPVFLSLPKTEEELFICLLGTTPDRTNMYAKLQMLMERKGFKNVSAEGIREL